MKYSASWQDILCRFNIWHRYNDWQYDTRTVQDGNGAIHPTQARFCFNCHWRKVKLMAWPTKKEVFRASDE